jgi:hypothetical protein
MPGIDDRREGSAELGQHSGPLDLGSTAEDLERLVDEITFNGKLAALIACACEKGSMYGPPSHADPGHAPIPGVQAAIQAYAAAKRTKEGSMDTDVRLHSGPAETSPEEPEILPLSLAGKWVAWSSDGMKIIASAETSEEAERLAIATGEPEPILERHPGRYRL